MMRYRKAAHIMDFLRLYGRVLGLLGADRRIAIGLALGQYRRLQYDLNPREQVRALARRLQYYGAAA